jgi:hypothetical protein
MPITDVVAILGIEPSSLCHRAIEARHRALPSSHRGRGSELDACSQFIACSCLIACPMLDQPHMVRGEEGGKHVEHLESATNHQLCQPHQTSQRVMASDVSETQTHTADICVNVHVPGT